MLIEQITTETGRVGLKIKSDELSKTVLRKKVTLSQRKPFLEEIAALEKRVNEAQESGNDDAALEASIEMILLMLDGFERKDFDDMDMFDVQQLAEAMNELMLNGGKVAKKNA